MDNVSLFKNGYEFAGNVEKSLDDMHTKFGSLAENETSVFMLGYAFYLLETAKYLDGASSESLSAKLNQGVAQQCIQSVVSTEGLSSESALELTNTLTEMANERSVEDAAIAVLAIL